MLEQPEGNSRKSVIPVAKNRDLLKKRIFVGSYEAWALECSWCPWPLSLPWLSPTDEAPKPSMAVVAPIALADSPSDRSGALKWVTVTVIVVGWEINVPKEFDLPVIVTVKTVGELGLISGSKKQRTFTVDPGVRKTAPLLQ
jgi:hypothetical protein